MRTRNLEKLLLCLIVVAPAASALDAADERLIQNAQHGDLKSIGLVADNYRDGGNAVWDPGTGGGGDSCYCPRGMVANQGSCSDGWSDRRYNTVGEEVNRIEEPEPVYETPAPEPEPYAAPEG
jgi:hypothetical protein